MYLSPIKIFFAYSQDRRDKRLKEQLEQHLSTLRSSNLERSLDVEVYWYKHQHEDLQDWNNANNKHLSKANVVVLLVSPAFMSLIEKNFRWNAIVKQVRKRYEEEEQLLIPVLLRPIHDWQNVLGNLAPLPKNGIPVTNKSWSNVDEALSEVARGITEIVEELKQKQQNLYKSNQDFYNPIQQEYPPSQQAVERLESRQKDLGFKDEDIARIQQQVQVTQEIAHRLIQQIIQYINLQQIIRYINQLSPSTSLAASGFAFVALAALIGLCSPSPEIQGNKFLMQEEKTVKTEKHQREVDAYKKRGYDLLSIKNYQAAIDVYTQLIRLAPDSVDAYNNRGTAHYNLKNYQAAIDDYTQLIRLTPDSADAYKNRGFAHYELKNYQAAIEDYQKAAEFYKQKGATDDYQQTLNQLQQLQQSQP